MVVIVDVGARGGLQRIWRKVKHEAHLFEPEAEAYYNLLETLPDNHKLYNMALSDTERELTINVCRSPILSSVYEYDIEYLSKYTAKLERFETTHRVNVKANTLDSLNIDADFIKIDVEGYAFPVLAGAVNTLDRCIGVEIEVDYLPIRKGASLTGLSDIHTILIEKGYLLHEFGPFAKRDRIVAGEPNKNGYVLTGAGPMWASNTVWLKPPEAIPADKKRQARVIYKVFGQSGYLQTLKRL